MSNILITSISSKIPLIQSIVRAKNKYDSNIIVFGADSNINNIGKNFVDKYWQMPTLKKLKINKIINFCKINKINYIIPTRDDDVVYFSKYKKILMKSGIYAFVSSKKSVDFCFDKLKFYKISKNKLVIQTSEDINQIKNTKKYVVKERFGAGSSLIAINVSKKKAINHSIKLQNPIFQPYIKGDEFSIDSYVDKNGICISSIVRSRSLVINGESKITISQNNNNLKLEIKSFLEKHKITGHSVIQVIKNNGTYYIVECNARFGGASTLSDYLGLKSFYWFLLETNNKNIRANISSKIIKQIRIQEDIYIEC